MKFKRIVLCIFVLFLCLTTFGCANVNLNTRINSSGVIETKINIKMTNTGNASESTVYSIVREYFKQLEKQYVVNLVNLYTNVYNFDELDDTQDKTKYDDLYEKFDYIYKENINKFLISKSENFSDEFKHDPINKTIVITKQFGSIYAYLMYFYPSAFVYDANINNVVISNDYRSMVDVPMGGDFKENDSLFITKYVQSCTPFYYNGSEPVFFENTTTGIVAGQTLISVLSEETNLSENEVALMFNFTTPYKRVHSDGTVTLTSNGYTHSWKLNSLGDNITIWRSYANYVPWYVLAGVIGILTFVIGAIVVAIVKNIKKKQGMKALKKINNLMNDLDKK